MILQQLPQSPYRKKLGGEIVTVGYIPVDQVIFYSEICYARLVIFSGSFVCVSMNVAIDISYNAHQTRGLENLEG